MNSGREPATIGGQGVRPPGPELAEDLSDGPAPTGPITLSPRAYLRSMAANARSSIRHPFSTTVVELTTGEAFDLG